MSLVNRLWVGVEFVTHLGNKYRVVAANVADRWVDAVALNKKGEPDSAARRFSVDEVLEYLTKSTNGGVA